MTNQMEPQTPHPDLPVGHRLHRHVGRTDVLLIDADNGSPGRHDGPPSEGPFAVFLHQKARGRLVAFDLDAKKHGAEMVLQDVLRLTKLLDQAGIGHMVAESGPVGGHHILIPVGTPYLSSRTMRALGDRLSRSGIAPTLDNSPLMNPSTGAIRVPGAPHRLGGHSTLLTNRDAAFDLIDRPCDPRLIEVLVGCIATPKTPRQLANKTRAPRLQPYIETADTDTSAALFHRARVVHARGGTYADFVADAKGLQGVRMQTRVRRGEKYLQQEWANAQRAPRLRGTASPAADETGQLVAWQMVLATGHHSLSASAARVGEALARQALGSHRRAMFGASVRDVAEWAGVGRQTASDGLHELDGAGLLEPGEARTGGGANRYRLCIPPDTDGHIYIGVLPDWIGGTDLDPSLDVWSHSGAGEQGRLTYRSLMRITDGVIPVTTARLAAELQLSVDATRARLRTLAKAGLARNGGSAQGWLLERRDMAEAAGALGVAGTGRERQLVHLSERADDAMRRTIRRLQDTIPGQIDPAGDSLQLSDAREVVGRG